MSADAVNGASASAAPASPQGGALRKDAVSLPGLLAQSVGTATPEVSAIVIGAGASIFLGAGTPFGFILATVLMVFFSRVLIRFARRVVHAGGWYSTTSPVWPRQVSFIGGWTYLMAMAIFVPALAVLGASTLQQFFAAAFHGSSLATASWIWYALGFIAIEALIIYRGIHVSARALLALTLLGVLSITVLDIAVLAHGGAHGIVWKAFLPSTLPHGTGFSSIALGVGLAFSAFAALETSIFLAEESSDRRMVPKAIAGALAILVVFYLLTSFSVVAGLGTKNVSSWGTQGGMVLDILGAKYIASGYGDYLLLVLAAAALTCSLGIFHACTRLMFDWGRGGNLPEVFARTSSRHKTPHVATAVLTVFAVVGCLAGLAWQGSSASAGVVVFDWGLIFGVLLWLGNYALIAAGGLVDGIKSRDSILSGYVVPIVSLAGLGAAVYGNVIPVPPSPFNTCPYVAIAWVVLGGVVLLVRGARKAAGREAPALATVPAVSASADVEPPTTA